MESNLNESYTLKRQQPNSFNYNDYLQPPRKRAAVFETANYMYSASTVPPHELWNIDELRLSCTEDFHHDYSQVASNDHQLVCFGMVRSSQLSDLILHF